MYAIDKINQYDKQGHTHGYWEIIHAADVYTIGHYNHGDMCGYWITQNNSYLNKTFIAR
jgi:hypothetical protein